MDGPTIDMFALVCRHARPAETVDHTFHQHRNKIGPHYRTTALRLRMMHRRIRSPTGCRQDEGTVELYIDRGAEEADANKRIFDWLCRHKE
jgi:hypothetical protein